jgi:HlyD family secretion protein
MSTDDLSKLRIDRNGTERTTRPKQRLRRRLRWTLVIVVAAVAALFLVWSGRLTPALEVESVKVSRMFASRALTDLNAAGYVVAQRKAAVSSKATGRLEELLVEEGTFVKKGHVLGRLENRDLEATLLEARANLKVSRARLKNVEAELRDATLNYHRQEKLKASGAVSAQSFDAAEARYKKAVALETSARFGVDSAQAAVTVAEVNLDYSYIRAPFDGVILTKNADEGEVVAPFGASLNAKAAVVTMADMKSLMVEVDVSESHLGKVKIGGACEISLDAFPGERFPGTVHMVVPTADRSKATVLTKIRFDKLDKRVLPEMSAKTAFLSRPLKPDERKPFPGLPKSSLRSRSNDHVAFLIEAGKVKAVPVKTGRQWDEIVEVLDGVKEGDVVVLKPDDRLQDGRRVNVKE